MADISMCVNKECDRKFICHRQMAKADEYSQSYSNFNHINCQDFIIIYYRTACIDTVVIEKNEQIEISCTYKKLKKLFGSPFRYKRTKNNKVYGKWVVRFEDGVECEIYNWDYSKIAGLTLKTKFKWNTEWVVICNKSGIIRNRLELMLKN
jgi:hypothetical protein